MSEHEIWSIVIAAAALVVSLISIYRTRKNEQIQLALTQINTSLAQKQLDRIEEEEESGGQPVFAILAEGAEGIGDFESPDYLVKINFKVYRSGEEYLRAQGIRIVTVVGGVFNACYNPYLEFVDVRKGDPILSSRTLIIMPNSNIHACRLHISYIDKEGWERFQQFKLYADGPVKHLPMSVKFVFDKTYRIVPRVDRWEL